MNPSKLCKRGPLVRVCRALGGGVLYFLFSIIMSSLQDFKEFQIRTCFDSNTSFKFEYIEKSFALKPRKVCKTNF